MPSGEPMNSYPHNFRENIGLDRKFCLQTYALWYCRAGSGSEFAAANVGSGCEKESDFVK